MHRPARKGLYDGAAGSICRPRFSMQRHYLHLAAFICEVCNGPVISGSFATRETEIERETDIQEIGSVCLSCRKQYDSFRLCVLYAIWRRWNGLHGRPARKPTLSGRNRAQS